MPRRIKRPLRTIREVPGEKEIVYVDREVPVEVEKIVEKEVIKEVQVKDSEAEQRLADVLEKLKEAEAKAQERRPETPEQPPEAIADLFHADRPFAEQARALRDLWLQIGHQIQRGEASVDQIRKHERLSSELEFINKHAFDGV